MSLYAKIIKKKKKKQGLTQKELAEKIPTSQQVIARWENDISKPRPENLYALADALEIPLIQFLQEDLVMTEKIGFDLFQTLPVDKKIKALNYMQQLKKEVTLSE